MKNEHIAGEHIRRVALLAFGSTALPRYVHEVGGVRLCLKIHWKYLHRVLDALVNSRWFAAAWAELRLCVLPICSGSCCWCRSHSLCCRQCCYWLRRSELLRSCLRGCGCCLSSAGLPVLFHQYHHPSCAAEVCWQVHSAQEFLASSAWQFAMILGDFAASSLGYLAVGSFELAVFWFGCVWILSLWMNSSSW